MRYYSVSSVVAWGRSVELNTSASRYRGTLQMLAEMFATLVPAAVVEAFCDSRGFPYYDGPEKGQELAEGHMPTLYSPPAGHPGLFQLAVSLPVSGDFPERATLPDFVAGNLYACRWYVFPVQYRGRVALAKMEDEPFLRLEIL